MPPDDDDFPDVRRALDAAPAPAVRPVDVAAIYRAAFDREARSARRWKRCAIGGLALAAGVLFAAVLPRLEVRADRTEFVVRWGAPPAAVAPPASPAPSPPPAVPSPDPAVVAAQLADLDARARQLKDVDARLRSLQDLLLTLAADVDERDRGQHAQLAAVLKHLRAFEAATREQFRQTERTTDALYSIATDKKPAGGTP